MTRNIGNRVGYSVGKGADGGIFNTLTQYVLSKSNRWYDYSVSIPSTYVPQTFTSGDYSHTVFTGSTTFTIEGSGGNINYFIVGGGGPGGSGGAPAGSGGGGGGGVRSGTIFAGPGVYDVTIGNGGPAYRAPNKNDGTGFSPYEGKGNGGDSSIICKLGNVNLVSRGGGRGAIGTNTREGFRATPGGCGGGGSIGDTDELRFGGNGTAGQGFAGGSSPTDFTWDAACGGGGAGQQGGSGPSNGGYGGRGRYYDHDDTVLPTAFGTPGPTLYGPPTARWFGGGGGGSAEPFGNSHLGGAGGAGGGGRGSDGPIPSFSNLYPPRPSTSGAQNTGGGGGGESPYNYEPLGGSGIIIISYLTPS